MSFQAFQAHVEDPQLFQRLALSERRSPLLWPVEFSWAVVAVGLEPLPSPAAVPSPPTVSRAATAVSPFLLPLLLLCARAMAPASLLELAFFVKTHNGKCAPLCITPSTSHSSLSSLFSLNRKYGQYQVPLRLSIPPSSIAVVVGVKRSTSLCSKFLSLSDSLFPLLLYAVQN